MRCRSPGRGWVGSLPVIPLPFAACLLATRARGPVELRDLRRLARGWRAAFDTIGAQSLEPAPRPVQSLGQRFLRDFLAVT